MWRRRETKAIIAAEPNPHNSAKSQEKIWGKWIMPLTPFFYFSGKVY